MIQTTTNQQRSSGSFPRSKKSQRNTTNSSKLPQRLILNPPKPPQHPKLALRSSKQPIFNRSAGDWMDFTLIGNGQDAPYHYGDICKVQAIMKIFNGSSSTTSSGVGGVEKDESIDVEMTMVDTELDDHTRVEQEMNDILQEALDCPHCEKTMHFEPEAMESDIRLGIYRRSEDPPFVLNQPREEIAPDEMPQEVWEPGYLNLATTAQQEKYLQLVSQHIDRNRANKAFIGMDDIDQGYESKFAFYCVDYHIHQHYIHRRSVLNLCRTNDEMDDFRYWKYKLALWTAQQNSRPQEESRDIIVQTIPVDDDTASEPASATTSPPAIVIESECSTLNPFTTPPSSPISSVFSSPLSSPSTAASSPPGLLSFPLPPPAILPWPNQQFTLSAQIILHRRLTNPRERAGHVRAAHKRFQSIMEERAIQRREGLAKAEYQATIAWNRWQLGKGGPLAITREGEIGELLQRFSR